MCNENKNGIRIPNFIFPFYVHHNKYIQKHANIATHKKPALPSSNPINILFKNGFADIPSESFITINNNLIFINNIIYTYVTTI